MKVDTGKTFCILCERNLPIKESHIIPKFILKWALRNGPVEHVRWSEFPNRPFKDIWKADYLCSICEGKFSRIEKQFEEQFFEPVIDRYVDKLQYSEYLLNFSLTLYFKCLQFLLDRTPHSTENMAISRLVGNLRGNLEALLDRDQPPDINSYLIFLPFLDKTAVFEPGINQYFLYLDMFVFHHFLPSGEKIILCGVKLPRLQFLFCEKPLQELTVKQEDADDLDSVQIKNQGTFSIYNVSRVILPYLLQDHYNRRARQAEDQISRLSVPQLKKVISEISNHRKPEDTIFHKAYTLDQVLKGSGRT